METVFQKAAVAAAYSGLLRYRHTCRKISGHYGERIQRPAVSLHQPLVIVFIVKLFSGRLRFAQLMSFIMGVCVFASFMFALFYIDWGFNYMRPSLYRRMNLTLEQRPVEELDALCRRLAV